MPPWVLNHAIALSSQVVVLLDVPLEGRPATDIPTPKEGAPLTALVVPSAHV